MSTETPAATTTTALHYVASPEAFNLWSDVYDDQLNPLLSLEERFLTQLLPDVKDLDIVDVGCGTGRWLELLQARSPKSLLGIDSSPQMLARAKVKVGKNAILRVAECTSLPSPDSSADLVLGSFVVSYLADLERFAAEIRRIARPHARVFITDLHSETIASCNWRRGFRIAGAAIEIATYHRTLSQTIAAFHVFGLQAACVLEPCFDAPERTILENAEKLQVFQSAIGHPAIYLLELRPVASPGRSKSTRTSRITRLSLTGARIACGAQESVLANLLLEEGHIASLGVPIDSPSGGSLPHSEIDLSGHMLLPGLINSHDHLEFGLFPNLGHGPYENFAQWAEEIHREDRATIARHRRVSENVRLWWGAIRNLLCGVTTVCHHNPLTAEFLDPGFPVSVLTRFGWAHSLTMDPHLLSKFHANPKDVPFILHAAEGVDNQSANDIFELDRMEVLSGNTILVHGLALQEGAASLLNRRGVALVWCPTSNCLLFGRTHDHKFLSSIDNVVLGSDSPLTAAGDLLDEIHFAHGVGVTADELYRMVITHPASVFRLQEGQGAIRSGGIADLVAVRDTGLSPAETLATISSKDIELVISRGHVQLASSEMMERLPHEITPELERLDVDGRICWIRAKLAWLHGEAQRVLGDPIQVGKKQVRYVCKA